MKCGNDNNNNNPMNNRLLMNLKLIYNKYILKMRTIHQKLIKLIFHNLKIWPIKKYIYITQNIILKDNKNIINNNKNKPMIENNKNYNYKNNKNYNNINNNLIIYSSLKFKMLMII